MISKQIALIYGAHDHSRLHNHRNKANSKADMSTSKEKVPELPLFPLGQMIEDASKVDARFADLSYAIHRLSVNDAEKGDPEKRALKLRTYLNSFPPECPRLEIRKGMWLIGMKFNEPLPVYGSAATWRKKSDQSRIRTAVCKEGEDKREHEPKVLSKGEWVRPDGNEEEEEEEDDGSYDRSMAYINKHSSTLT